MAIKEEIHIIGQQLKKISAHTSWLISQKNKALFELFTLILEEATKDDRLNFTTLFSRLAFVGTKYQLKSDTLHYCHIYRKGFEQSAVTSETAHLYESLGYMVCTGLVKEVFKYTIPDWRYVPDAEIIIHFKKEKKKTIGFKPIVEAVLFEIDHDHKTLYFYDEADPDTEKKALYDIHDKNELFNQNIESLRKTFRLPIHVNFIDTDIRDDGYYIPMGIIIQPDHLVDVTSVSECFKEYGSEPFLYLISKFKPAEVSPALMTGNLVNYMLDELISDPSTRFNDMLSGMFASNPVGFAMFDDQSLKALLSTLHEHFKNLQRAVSSEFENFGIKRDHIFLEPSFYSRDYGIQGRLDLLHEKQGQSAYDIVELKSGKTFKPNVYGINASHYVQTLLYDLMIKSTFHTRSKSFNYILYSKESEKSLRFAPPVKAQQYEAMKLRNDIIAIEQKLKNTDRDNSIITYIKPENFPKLKGFNIKDIEVFQNIYATLDDIEKSYFDHFCGFIAREHSLAKTGEHGINKSNGHAALWLESDEEKKDRFALLTGLVIAQNNSDQQDAFLVFSRNPNDLTLVNFREGDIAVLYPDKTSEANRTVLQNQIFKCTITALNADTVSVKLRNKQYNQSLFRSVKLWKIEQDTLDSGFNSMYKSLFTWAAAPVDYRRKILGRGAPRADKSEGIIFTAPEMTSTQAALLQKILEARDYFLLWGPPGTGKTSVMLKNMVKYLHQNTRQNILLLAYTNRAVDEICDAVSAIDPSYEHAFYRLGSRQATDSKYIHNLMDQALKGAENRQRIIELLTEKRIYISTISSIINRSDLFMMKDFDTVIIDEASQILEPMLCGLLTKCKKFILIGDHKQLPAVVVQDSVSSKIENEQLNQLDITDTRISMFERLFMQVTRHKWDHAYGILEQQGRMHDKLMDFPNAHFYDGKLRLLPGKDRQTKPDFIHAGKEKLKYLHSRTIFIHAPEDETLNWKTNLFEAQICVQLLLDLIAQYADNNMEVKAESIGIITPYRAQIALIRTIMEKYMSPEITSQITVDTVERYQGGARDIIIISFCINRLSQLDNLVSLSQEGIDRKLNVALTRAKEKIILVGNKSLLSNNKVYKQLIACYDEQVISCDLT